MFSLSNCQLDPEIFLTFLPNFVAYRDKLANKKRTVEENHILASVDVLLEWLHSEYSTTIATIEKLTSHGEITFELLYALLVPRSIFIAQCAVTGKPRALKLMSIARTSLDDVPAYQLICESIDLIDRLTTNTIGIGPVESIINLTYFLGTAKITSLAAYPIHHHPATDLRQSLIERGRKWLSLNGIHHKQYNGVAAFQRDDKKLKHRVWSYIFSFTDQLTKQQPFTDQRQDYH
jgi:hypothetical protein